MSLIFTDKKNDTKKTPTFTDGFDEVGILINISVILTSHVIRTKTTTIRNCISSQLYMLSQVHDLLGIFHVYGTSENKEDQAFLMSLESGQPSLPHSLHSHNG
jgi:hypothetical protein